MAVKSVTDSWTTLIISIYLQSQAKLKLPVNYNKMQCKTKCFIHKYTFIFRMVQSCFGLSSGY